MSTESFIALGLTFSLFIMSEQLIHKYQCRQKSIEAFWHLNLSHIWRNSPPTRTYMSVDRCQITSIISMGKINSWSWGNGQIEFVLSPGTNHE